MYSLQPIHLSPKANPSTVGAVASKDGVVITPDQAAQDKKLVKQTQKWVAQTFYGQLLRQMRQDPFKSQMMDGGRGGAAFGEMFDQQMADHMTRGAGMKLVNSIVDRIEDPGDKGKRLVRNKAARDAYHKMRARNWHTATATDQRGAA